MSDYSIWMVAFLFSFLYIQFQIIDNSKLGVVYFFMLYNIKIVYEKLFSSSLVIDKEMTPIKID